MQMRSWIRQGHHHEVKKGVGVMLGLWMQRAQPEALLQSRQLLERDAGQSQLLTVLQRTWALAAALVVIYIITLAIFPGFLVEDVNSASMGSW